MTLRTHWLLFVLCLPLLAHAEAYKCKQPNGTVSFQEEPCPVGTKGSAITLKPIPGGTTEAPAAPAKGKPKKFDPADTPQNKELEAKRRRAQEEVDAHNQEVAAHNKAQRCNSARQQLGVLKEPRPVYRYNDKGERQYVGDENRQAETAAAEKRVAEACR